MGQTGHGRTVLVVDDEPGIRALLEALLSEAGYRVRMAPDGMAALDEVEREAPDLVLTDIMMPRLDGASLLARLRLRGLAVPVVLMSAYGTGQQWPGIPFLAKPFDLPTVLATVEEELGGVAA